MIIYNAKYKKGVSKFNRISLVSAPAIEENLVKLSLESESPVFVFSDESKREILTPVLIPNKPIFRKANDKIAQDFYIVFNEETIKDISYDVIANRDLLFTSEHTSEIITGIEIQQVFLSNQENGIHPKQYNQLPSGTLFVVLKINDDKAWNDINTGVFKGVSVEVSLDLEQGEVEQETQMQRVLGLFKSLINGN